MARLVPAGITSASVVLDLGCGLGVNSVWLAETFGCRVIGLDISGEMIEYCKKELGPATVRQYVQKGVPKCDAGSGEITRTLRSQAEAEGSPCRSRLWKKRSSGRRTGFESARLKSTG